MEAILRIRDKQLRGFRQQLEQTRANAESEAGLAHPNEHAHAHTDEVGSELLLRSGATLGVYTQPAQVDLHTSATGMIYINTIEARTPDRDAPVVLPPAPVPPMLAIDVVAGAASSLRHLHAPRPPSRSSRPQSAASSATSAYSSPSRLASRLYDGKRTVEGPTVRVMGETMALRRHRPHSAALTHASSIPMRPEIVPSHQQYLALLEDEAETLEAMVATQREDLLSQIQQLLEPSWRPSNHTEVETFYQRGDAAEIVHAFGRHVVKPM